MQDAQEGRAKREVARKEAEEKARRDREARQITVSRPGLTHSPPILACTGLATINIAITLMPGIILVHDEQLLEELEAARVVREEERRKLAEEEKK